MKKRFCLLFVVFLAIAQYARAADDTLKLISEKQPLRGVVAEMTPTQVTLKQGPLDKKFSVKEIEWINYDDEPLQLASARRSFLAGKYPEAVTAINKVPTEEVKRPEIKQDVEFYKAMATARLALAGGASVSEAGKALLEFEKKNPTSYHYLAVCEAIGDLFASIGKHDQAVIYYGKLAAAPWPVYRMKADVAIGRALLARKDYPGATQKFDAVLKQSASGTEADAQRLAASLGMATATAGEGQTDEAVKAIDQVIDKADPEDGELLSRAYNAKGTALLTAGKKKEALMAFLHVDLLFSNYPEQHAEALANLATLWKDVDQAQRANLAAATLRQRYPSSRWVKK